MGGEEGVGHGWSFHHGECVRKTALDLMWKCVEGEREVGFFFVGQSKNAML